jgi:hypothetical protein
MVAAKDFETPLEIEDVMDSLASEITRIPFTNAADEAVFVTNATWTSDGLLLEMSDETSFLIPEIRKVGS